MNMLRTTLIVLGLLVLVSSAQAKYSGGSGTAAVQYVPGQGTPHPIPEEEGTAVFLGWDRNRDNVECYTVTHPGVDYVPNEIIIQFKRQVADSVEGQLKLKTPPGKLKLSNGLDKLNARYRMRKIRPVFKNFKKNHQWLKGLPHKRKALLSKKEKHILNRLSRAPKGAMVPELDRIYKIELGNGQSLREAVAAYNNDPDVEYAELHYIVYLDATPNDPYYSMQWSLNNTGQDYPVGPSSYRSGTPDCDIDAPEAWDVNTGSSDIVIAVIDTGVDYTHRDLQANMWVNNGEIPDNDIDDDDNGYVDDVYGYDLMNEDGDPVDDHGHGTHCAGTIAAISDNGFDVAGVCWNARIMSLKVFSESGGGCGCDIYQAFYYAVNNGADITSNSWGGGGYSQTNQQIIDYVHSQGVLTVASAGNGNSSALHYPSGYGNVIGVAATDSDDKKASFSNYGDRVDIAAPGVDVLSLRAAGTSLGTVYDDYTTILSGTSMSCPHVSAVAALIMSRFPGLGLEDLEMRLLATVDDITEKNPDYKWLLGTGRLNAHKAVKGLLDSFDGLIAFDASLYSCDDIVAIRLSDLDIAGAGTQQVTVTTDGGDQETVTLAEETDRPWIFAGTIPLSTDYLTVEDGMLQVSHGQLITVTYYDANDSSGNPATMEDTAAVDCEPPVISNVQIDILHGEPTVTFETDEPTTARVLCSLACGGEYIVEAIDSTLTTTHAIKIRGVYPETTYFSIVEAADFLEHTTIDDNAGQCYSFTTLPAPEPVYVPADYPTIQAAIDDALPGATIIVADGTYSGEGNRDIYFLGKVITVKSENGPNNCIIDCGGTETEMRRGFLFAHGEDPNSILDGFTVTNAYAPGGYTGGAILGYDDSSPTITNCIFANNVARYGGGAMFFDSSPTITNCTFRGNSVSGIGGGLCNLGGSMTITNCRFIGNSALPEQHGSGGGMYNRGDSTITNCTFIGNSAFGGGGLMNVRSSSTITDCVFAGNSAHGSLEGCTGAGQGGGLNNNAECEGTTISNCIFINNTADMAGGVHNWSASTYVNCKIIENSASVFDAGGMMNHGMPTLVDCTFAGNTAVGNGGGIKNYAHDEELPGSATLINCTFSENTADEDGGGIDNYSYTEYRSSMTFSNCVFSGNTAGNNGGAMSNAHATATFANCTFVANSAANRANALDCRRHWFWLPPGLIGLANCILWDGGNEIYNEDGSRIFMSYSDVQGGWPGEGNINEDPGFAFSTDYHLMPGSACIDAGRNTSAAGLPTDIDGNPRILDGNGDGTDVADMGAHEYNPDGLSIATSALSITFVKGPPQLDPQTLGIRSCGSGTLNWEIVGIEDCNWLQVSPTSGVSSGEVSEVTLTVEPGNLAAGNYTHVLKIVDEIAVNSPTEVVVTLRIGPVENLRTNNRYLYIQDAIDQAQGGDEIVAGRHRYYEGVDLKGKNLTLRSEEPENPAVVANTPITVIHAEPVVSFTHGEGRDCLLSGFTIWAGFAERGAGIYCSGGSCPTISNCRIVNNWAGQQGGGIYCHSSSPIITKCVISSCTASGDYDGLGAGLYCENSDPQIINCLIADNSCGYGAGIHCASDSNCVISNCTIANNSAIGKGGGIRLSNGSQAAIDNGILWGNQAALGPQVALFGNCSVSAGYSDIQGGEAAVLLEDGSSVNWGQTNIDADALFADAGDGDYHLLPGSPCIDAATDAGVYTDIEGNTRPFNFLGVDNNGELPEFDMGAYEAVVPLMELPMKFTPQAVNPGSQGNWMKAHFVLPEGFGVDDVDVNTPAVIEPLGIESSYVSAIIGEDRLVKIEIAFGRADFCSSTDYGPAEVSVVGALTAGQYFYGADTIRIIKNNFQYLALLASHWLATGCGQPDWCNGLDVDQNSTVDFVDFAMFDGCCIQIVTE